MGAVTLFKPGDRVHKRKDPDKKGIVEQAEPMPIGASFKQKVKWDDGASEYINIKFLEPEGAKELTLDERILQGLYGKREDLRSGITANRLGGALDNLIYSLNLTNTEFKPYQFIPLLTLIRSMRTSLLIADEVGLGKTIEAGLIWTELQMRDNAQRLLVVCPAALCQKWRDELFYRFNVDAQIVNAAELLEGVRRISTGEVRNVAFIASLQGIRPPSGWKEEAETSNHRPAELARALGDMSDSDIFNLMILDEAHHIRNRETRQFQIVELLRGITEKTLFLSATPVQTDQDNLFSLLNILDKDTFPYPGALNRVIWARRPLVELIAKLQTRVVTVDEFKAGIEAAASACEGYGIVEEGATLKAVGGVPTGEELKSKDVRLRLIRALRRLDPLSQVMVRSLKRHVEKNRVERSPITVEIELTHAERHYYSAITEQVRWFCEKNHRKGGFMECIAQRQMSSCMPVSLEYWGSGGGAEEISEARTDDIEEEEDSSPVKPLLDALRKSASTFPEKAELLRADSKLEKLKEVLLDFRREHPGEKVVLFSFFKRTLAYLERKLAEAGIRCVQITGDHDRDERSRRLAQFRDGDADVLLSSEVASEGIDLQFASCLVNYDLPWNPARIEQRIGRIDRFGQKASKILIFNFVYKGTIESEIYRRLLERFNVFCETLGVAEEILGYCIKKLEKGLFSQQLTKEEEVRKIDEAAYAIKNNQMVKDEADGESMVYDLMQNQVMAAQELERYVLDDDLLDFVQDFCRRDKGGSRLYETAPGSGLYSLCLSSDARAEVEEFFREHSLELPPTELLSNPDLKLRFLNRMGVERRGIERVTQNHPLVRFVAYWNRKTRAQNYLLSAVELRAGPEMQAKLSDVPAGTYAYRVSRWQYLGVKGDKARLSYFASDLRDGCALTPDQAEVLVNMASRQGQNIFKTSTLPNQQVYERNDENQEREDEAYAEFKKEMGRQAKSDAEFSIRMHQARLEEMQRRREDQLRKFEREETDGVKGVQGRRAVYEKKFAKGCALIEARIAEVRRRLEKQQCSGRLVSAGIIRLEF